MRPQLQAARRYFNPRSPILQTLVLVATILLLAGITLRFDTADSEIVIRKTASLAKGRFSEQRPMSGQLGVDTPTVLATSTEIATTLANTTAARMNCDYDTDKLKVWQENYKLGHRFEYTKRYVKASRQDIPRRSMTKLDQAFMPDSFDFVDLKKELKSRPGACLELLELPVTPSPFPRNANASDFIFGVSTTHDRWTNPATSAIGEWTYWLTDGKGNSNGGKLLLMLLDASDAQLQEAHDRLAGHGIDVDVQRSDKSLAMAARYLSVVPALYAHPDREGRKWVVMCDDDTFFPSFNALAEHFEQFDHTMPMYIGALSEDVNNVQRHGSQAFGGAGVFLSVPMAKIVSEAYNSCTSAKKIRESDSGWGPQGDILLRKCVYENSETKLTLVQDLWQLDIRGDAAGFYESGIRPLSLHHYRGGMWHKAFPWKYAKISQVCGEDCLMQRFRFADDFILSNGVSVAWYPKGIDFDVNQVERTFGVAPDDKGWNLDYKMGPQRKSLAGTGRKISWDLQDSIVNDDGSITQVYVRRADDKRWIVKGKRMSDVDGIIELVWLP